MYLYLGGGSVIEERDIVGVFDLDNTSWSRHTRRFLSMAEKDGLLENAAPDIPRSFVVSKGGNIILTQPNTATLARRLNEQEKINV